MANYTGKKCFSCGEVFKDGDDIVVLSVAHLIIVSVISKKESA